MGGGGSAVSSSERATRGLGVSLQHQDKLLFKRRFMVDFNENTRSLVLVFCTYIGLEMNGREVKFAYVVSMR